MVKEFLPDTKHHLPIAIKQNFKAGMRPIEIAKLFKISKQKVNYWLHNPIKQRKRRTKLTRKEINKIVKWAKDKPIMECRVSAKNVQARFNKLPKKMKEKKKKKMISLSTENRILNKYVGKPRTIRKVFYLKPSDKKLRVEFCKFMKENNLGPQNIFFTDESNFPFYPYMNRGTNKIRLCKKTERKLKAGDEKANELVTRQYHKFNDGILVSGGICDEGLGQIIFHSGNVNSFAYKQVLKFYREDLNKYQSKIFQQDGARSHSSKLSKNIIQALFKDKFIPTWEKGPKYNDKYIPRWPPNSPDLSAIEIIWSIIKQMLILFPAKDMDALKKHIKVIWDSIPKAICQNIIEHIKYRWELCIKFNGRRIDKELLRKIPKIGKEFKFHMKNESINGVRISYNDKFILRLKKKDIKEKTKLLSEQRKKEKEAREKLNKLLKMKPKDYKNISEEEKRDTKFEYDLEKTRTDMLEEEIKKLEKMCPLDYLSCLNEETKEKLIGLCMDRNILNSLEDETIYGDTEEEVEEENEFEEDEKDSILANI